MLHPNAAAVVNELRACYLNDAASGLSASKVIGTVVIVNGSEGILNGGIGSYQTRLPLHTTGGEL